MKAVVLAGGYATRLWPVTRNRPKMLLPVGETTVIDRILVELERDDRIEDVFVSTNERFADDSGRRDIAELGERLGELTVQCVSACPDCLETDAGLCLHGAGQQGARLNRRLLTAVFGR